MLLDNIEIIVGTYEEFLLGYKPKLDDSVYSLRQTFATHRHTASVRCVASNGAMMASGGSDEYVHLYDMAQRKEIGSLMHHSGTVNCLAYTPDGSHLLSGGNDGVLAICRVAGFVLEKTWHSAHKGEAILGISVHPSSKLALTVGSDATLQTWNLIKGRRAYGTRLGSSKIGAGWLVTGVCWNLKGTFYAVGMGAIVDIYCVESAAVVYSIKIDSKACSFCFINNVKLCIGSENGMMYAHNVKKKTCLSQQKAHDQRVKSVGSVSSKDEVYVVSASSNGEIKLWHYKGDNFQEICKVATGCRITCLTIPTCGYPSHFKEECEEDIDVNKMLDEEGNQCVSTRPNVREVVITEDDDDLTCLTIPTCGYPSHFKEECEEDIDVNKMNQSVSTRPNMHEVVIIEADGDNDDDDLTEKRQTKKRKKRGKTSAKDKDEHEDFHDKTDVKILSKKKKKMGGDDEHKDPCFDDTHVKTQTKKTKKKKIGGGDEHKGPCFHDTDVKIQLKKKKGSNEDKDPCNVNMDITIQSKKKKKISSGTFCENGSWLESETLTKERNLSLTCQDDVDPEKHNVSMKKRKKNVLKTTFEKRRNSGQKTMKQKTRSVDFLESYHTEW